MCKQFPAIPNTSSLLDTVHSITKLPVLLFLLVNFNSALIINQMSGIGLCYNIVHVLGKVLIPSCPEKPLANPVTSQKSASGDCVTEQTHRTRS